ncbi:flagellar basal body rod modification protein [Campylobacter hyointestinalis]|uniref:flagellar basal body rod modification protein n=1 Tax=Campylobacter hyointestinalis TaxID=198 RepID=UPI0025523CA1|nr:flagellar basal body rod modification protein [Campylobacter hyointestinalis]MDL2346127.1 flagellar basal body rod modification protein [Campylobacter hyointestinalis]MDL2347867.1 flagellar basal body rod modification protein [Campylobacter hyointestinalis]MDL2349610.1 flagellar basal body rod modification protein [Campylobacter hyointestinalis]MDM1025715.1 flagellar basal body rod modification protein [Campylobacter hyointestinalis]MDM1027615.1 flagellar basal body rod modification protein
MAISSVNNTTTPTFTTDQWAAAETTEKENNVAGTGTNPNATLDKDAFMKLLLTELQYQDPTEPMDSAKMLEQTSQLATLEMQENTNKVMKQLTKQMQGSLSMTAMSALGKIANLSNAISKDTATSSVDFKLYFDNSAKFGNVEIYDSTGNVVKTIPFKELNEGINEFTWDGTDNDGLQTLPGEYLIKASYTDTSDQKQESVIGSYPVEAVKFVDGVAQVKIAGEYVAIDKITEFTEPVKKTTVSNSGENSSEGTNS